MSKRSREDDHSSSEDGSYDGEHNEAQKYALLDNEDDLNKKAVITCSLPPHSETIPFYSYNEYEVHYKQNHYNRCFGCHKNLPTEHFLMLHIAENHDPLNQAKRGRGEKIYACFVEGCDKVCMNSGKRRMHLVDKHGFPPNYDFFIVNDGMDRRQSLLRSNNDRLHHKSRLIDDHKTDERGVLNLGATDMAGGSHTSENVIADEAQSTESQNLHSCGKESSPRRKTEHELENITRAMSALKFLPPSVRFGRRGGRSGFAKQ